MENIKKIPATMMEPYGPLWYGDNGIEWDERFGPIPDNLEELVAEELRIELAAA